MTNNLAFGVVAASGSTVAPTVSALADGDVNSGREDTYGTVYVGVQWNTDGDEYERTINGSYSTNVNTWLTAGTSSQVWVVFNRTSGSLNFDGITSGTRYQISINRSYGLSRGLVGSDTITGTFAFYDAASGGNLLDSTSSATWTATMTVDPCPICCFTPETPVLMSSGLWVPIGQIQEGDEITTLNGPEKVTEIITRRNRVMYRITLADDTWIDASEDHPFDVKGEPKSINPIIEYKDIGMPQHLTVGDCITNTHGKNVRIVDITKIKYPGTVYTLGNTLFYAKGMLVY